MTKFYIPQHWHDLTSTTMKRPNVWVVDERTCSSAIKVSFTQCWLEWAPTLTLSPDVSSTLMRLLGDGTSPVGAHKDVFSSMSSAAASCQQQWYGHSKDTPVANTCRTILFLEVVFLLSVYYGVIFVPLFWPHVKNLQMYKCCILRRK